MLTGFAYQFNSLRRQKWRRVQAKVLVIPVMAAARICPNLNSVRETVSCLFMYLRFFSKSLFTKLTV